MCLCEQVTQRNGDIMLRGRICTVWGQNGNKLGTLCNIVEIKCNGDIMNGDKTFAGWGPNVTGVGTQ